MKDLLQIGDVIKLTHGDKVYAMVPKAIVYVNSDSESPTRALITIGKEYEKDGIKFIVPADREYVVTSAHLTGGQSGMFISNYPDGWFIVARMLDKNGNYNAEGRSVYFYQTGHFNAMIPHKDVLYRKKMTFI